MTKQWTADHVALASAVELARSELRAILPRLPESQQRRVAFAVDVLSHGLKARAHQTSAARPAANGAPEMGNPRRGGGPNDLLRPILRGRTSCTDGVVVAPKMQGGADCPS